MAFTLQTNRLILRPFEDGDILTFSDYRSDPEVARYQGWDTPYSPEQAAQFVQRLKDVLPGTPGEWYQIAIELKQTGQLIGDCVFQILDEDHQQAEIGYTLARPFQGRGYATEAVKALLGYLFETLNLHRVRANCDPENLASARLLLRAGMRHEGRFVDSLWLKGHWYSEDWFAILDREWAEQKTQR